MLIGFQAVINVAVKDTWTGSEKPAEIEGEFARVRNQTSFLISLTINVILHKRVQ